MYAEYPDRRTSFPFLKQNYGSATNDTYEIISTAFRFCTDIKSSNFSKKQIKFLCISLSSSFDKNCCVLSTKHGLIGVKCIAR